MSEVTYEYLPGASEQAGEGRYLRTTTEVIAPSASYEFDPTLIISDKSTEERKGFPWLAVAVAGAALYFATR